MPTEWYIKPVEPGRSATPFTVTGRFVLLSFAAFFIVVAAVNALMMTMAISTMPGLDARNGYDVSQRYNGEIARMQDQTRLGWQADARVSRKAADADIVFTVKAADKMAIDDLAVTAMLLHPASRKLDRTVTLQPTGNGAYEASIPAVTSGAWTLTIDAARDGKVLFTSQNRIHLKG